jgi:hypothetical protein
MDKQLAVIVPSVFLDTIWCVCVLVAVWGRTEREERKKQQKCVWKGKIKEK